MSKLARRGITGTAKAWTPDEERKLRDMINQGMPPRDVKAAFPDRSDASVKNKLRKTRIKMDCFGEDYRESKQEFTRKIGLDVDPEVVVEAYAGSGHQTIIWLEKATSVYASERDANKAKMLEQRLLKEGFQQKSEVRCGGSVFEKDGKSVTVFQGDAVLFAAHLCASGVQPDVLDLDTCGSTIPTLGTFLALLRPKNMVITHGEFHSQRMNREDVMRRLLTHRDIRTSTIPKGLEALKDELHRAVCTQALRAHNETHESFWPTPQSDTWLDPSKRMLRRHYSLSRPQAAADAINKLSGGT